MIIKIFLPKNLAFFAETTTSSFAKFDHSIGYREK
jgi:hypothetical protein